MTKSILSFIALIFIWSQPVSAENFGLSKATIKTIDGNTIKLGEIIGKKPVYLKFWATWCIPCRKQMPHFQKSFEKYGNQVEFLAINININDSLNAIIITQQEFQLTMPIVIDEGAQLAQAFDLRATPYHVLINKQGNIVHTGHDASPELDNTLRLLATDQARNLKSIALNKTKSGVHKLKIQNRKPSVVLFTSAWCGWYLEKSRPNMAKECIDAQQQVNALSVKYPNLNWQGVLTRLWTGEKELNDYKKKYNVPFTMSVDSANEHFFDFKVDSFPTLIVFKNGKELFRTNDFNDTKQLHQKLNSLVSTQTR